MIKILFLIDTLRGGGAERVLCNLVAGMDRQKFDITVRTMFDGGVNAARLPSDIRYIEGHSPCPHGIAYIYRFIPSGLLYRHFAGSEHYDIVVAYLEGTPVKVIEGCPDKSTKKIAFLHNGSPETSACFRFWHTKKRAFAVYRRLDAVAAVADSVKTAFENYSGITHNTHTIYNTNDSKKICELSLAANPLPDGGFNIVSVGNLRWEKSFDRLINTVCRLRKEGFECRLTVVGGGKLKKDLQNLIDGNSASDYITLAGFAENPYPYIKNADLFVCSSLTEGLSTAVTEAVILGVPCVSTDVSGAREILGANDEYGIVVPNSEQGIYDGIKRMLTVPQTIEYYRKMSAERAEKFTAANTVKAAEDLFTALYNSTGAAAL